MQAEGSYGGRVVGVGRINGYEGAGEAAKQQKESCAFQHVSVSPQE